MQDILQRNWGIAKRNAPPKDPFGELQKSKVSYTTPEKNNLALLGACSLYNKVHQVIRCWLKPYVNALSDCPIDATCLKRLIEVNPPCYAISWYQ